MSERVLAVINLGDMLLRCVTIYGAAIFEAPLASRPYAIDCSATEIFACGFEQTRVICVFSFSGQHVQTISPDAVPVTIAVHKSGLKFACGFANGILAIYARQDDIWTMETRWQACAQPIHRLAWLSDHRICFGLDSGSIVSWNAESGERIKAIQFEGPELRSLSPISSDGRFIFSGYLSGIVRKHGLEDGSTSEMRPHRHAVTAVCVSDVTVLTSSMDRTVAAFDIETLTEKWRYQCVHFATSLVVVTEEVFVGVQDSFVVVLNVNTGEFVRQFAKTFSGPVRLAVQSTEFPFARFKFVD